MIIFALVLIPVIGAVGAAVDYSRANSARTAMQAALDSAALMLAKEALNLDPSQMAYKATVYFQAMFHRPDVTAVQIAYTFDSKGPTLTLTGSASVPTTFASVLGHSQMKISSSSQVVWGMKANLRIALVLDVTKSMSDNNRIGKLKTAAQGLLKTLQSSAQNADDILVAIVPFANSVNVGTNNINASWLTWGCYDNSKSWDSRKSCGVGTSKNKSDWDGCVMDREQDYDVQNTTPVTNNNKTLFPAIYTTECPESLIPLSSDWAALNAKVKALTASGSKPLGGTNNTIGTAWGWQALTAGDPLNPPSLANTKRIIIQMTDGQNTDNRWSSKGSDVDARFAKACQNAKADGVIIYMVVVEAGNSSVMRNCASDSTKYFPISSNQLAATFEAIGTELSQLRIAK